MLKDISLLLERCIRREQKAWEEFVEKFSGLLYYSARERLRRGGFMFGKQDIEDIVQIVFTEILEKGRLCDVRDRGKIKAWLSIMAQTRALNYMRKKKERLLYQEEFYKFDNMRVDANVGLDEDTIKRVEGLMEVFDARDRIILKLSIIHGKKHREIAGFMNISINTVSTIITRKKKILKKILKENM